MNTAARHTKVVLWLLAALAAGLMLATAGTASAEPAITSTEVSTFSESFADEPFVCQDELYFQTVSGRTVLHFTYLPDTGAFHLHDAVVRAEVVAVPLDGTGPTFTGAFAVSDSENIRAVKNGDVLVEVDTDLNRVIGRGSDGSRVFLKEHAHFTVNANGDTTVQLDTARLVCA